MSKDRILMIVLLSLLLLLPLIFLPLVNLDVKHSTFALQEEEAQKQADSEDEGGPVRLLTLPLLGASGRMKDAIVAVIDMPSKRQADKLCDDIFHLNDTLQTFTVENPERIDRRTRIPGRDPELLSVLRKKFPQIKIDGVRLTQPTAYKELHPRLDVFECRDGSFRRLATQAYQ